MLTSPRRRPYLMSVATWIIKPRIIRARELRAHAKSTGSHLPRAPYNQEDLNSIQKLSTDELNAMVQSYKSGNVVLRDTIIKQFHPLIHKYVRLIKGCKAKALVNYDTIQFLALFQQGQVKSFSGAMGVIEYLGSLTRDIDEEDIYNQIVAMLLVILDKFKAARGVNSLGYLVTNLRWDLKNWLQLEVPNTYPPFSDTKDIDCMLYAESQDSDLMQGNLDFNTEEIQETEYSGLSEMTLAWVQETDDPLFKDLSVYQRQLLYLSFKQGLGVEKIAQRLSRDKDTIHRHLSETLAYLKSSVQQ